MFKSKTLTETLKMEFKFTIFLYRISTQPSFLEHGWLVNDNTCYLFLILYVLYLSFRKLLKSNVQIYGGHAAQKTVTLSVTEAEGSMGVTDAQDMMDTCCLPKSIELKVKLPMLLEIDNKGAVYLANNWSVGGRARQVDVRNCFFCVS